MKRNCPHCRFYWAWKLKDGRFKCRRCGKGYSFRSVWQVSRLAEQKKHTWLRAFSDDELETLVAGSRNAQKQFLRLTRMTMAYYERYRTPFTGSPLSFLPDGTPPQALSSNHSSALVLGMHQKEQGIGVFPIFGPDATHLTGLFQTQHEQGTGRLYYTTERHAFGLLSLQNDMVMTDANNESQTHVSDHIEDY